MPSISTQRQRELISKFIEHTNASRETALNYLASNNYDIQRAVNQYFDSKDAGYARGSREDPTEKALKQLFDSLSGGANELGLEQIAGYADALGIDANSFELFVLTDLVKVESMGQITRDGFVNGWKQFYESNRRVTPSLESQKQHIRGCIDQCRSNPEYFKKVYRSAFLAGKEAGKREMEIPIAFTYWELLFEPTLRGWRSTHVDFFTHWKEFLRQRFRSEEKARKDAEKRHAVDPDEPLEVLETDGWTRTISKDLWNQTLLFAYKTLEDETLGFWSEEQAWPGLIDDFVVWCKKNGVVKGDGMDVDN